MTREPFAAEVAAYLADCAAHRRLLSPRYHPTEDGALKVIPHHHPKDPEAEQTAEAQIRAAYRAARAAPAPHRKDPPVNTSPARNTTPAAASGHRDDALLNAALGCAARGWHVFPRPAPAKKPPAFPDHTPPTAPAPTRGAAAGTPGGNRGPPPTRPASAAAWAARRTTSASPPARPAWS